MKMMKLSEMNKMMEKRQHQGTPHSPMMKPKEMMKKKDMMIKKGG